MANIVGSLYAISLNCQMFLPTLIKIPRPVFVFIVTAVCVNWLSPLKVNFSPLYDSLIPVAIEAAKNFYHSLESTSVLFSSSKERFC